LIGVILVLALALWAIVSAVLVVAKKTDSAFTKCWSYATFGAAPIVAALSIYMFELMSAA
jgi:hypothetical protein